MVLVLMYILLIIEHFSFYYVIWGERVKYRTMICVTIFALIYYFNTTRDYKTQKEMLEIYNEQQKEYFSKLLEKEQEKSSMMWGVIL